MPNLYYPTPDELRGARPLNEQLWFPLLQDVLVALANTQEGKDLLCIDDLGLPIVRLAKNEVRYDVSKELGPKTYISDFRVGAKWGNVVRYRWQEIKKALDRMSLEYLLSLPKHIVAESGLFIPVPAGAATLSSYPDPHPESTSVDGKVFRSLAINTSDTWTDIRNGAGTWATDTQQGPIVNIQGGWSYRWQTNQRSIYLFNTASIGSSSTISAATFGIPGGSKNNQLGGSPSINVYTSSPASNTALVAADYNPFGTTAQSATPILYSNWGSSTTSYHTWTFNSTGIGNVSKTSVSKFGVREVTWDVNNSSPTWGGTLNFNMVGNFSDTSAGTAYDPKLYVTYTLPTTAAVTGEIGNGATEQAVRSAT